MPEMQIRHRYRRGYVREAGRHMEWEEWQVVDGRKVIARFDFREQAEAFIAKRKAQGDDNGEA